METFSALLAICTGNSPVPGEFPAQRPVTRSFDVSFDLHPNKRLSRQWWGWWFETPSCPLWRHRNDINRNILNTSIRNHWWSTVLCKLAAFPFNRWWLCLHSWILQHEEYLLHPSERLYDEYIMCGFYWIKNLSTDVGHTGALIYTFSKYYLLTIMFVLRLEHRGNKCHIILHS